MFLRLFFSVFRKGWSCSGMLVLVLGMVTGPALGQEVGGWNRQPEIAALSAVLINATTGETVFTKEPHLRLPPASTTKVLTALVALERLDPNDRLWVSPQAASAPPSRIGLRAGEAATTQDLLYGLLLKSGNDAAETLAEAAGGSVFGFAELMNAKAWQIGARDSHFMNPHGLPNDDHYSTAYDLALIFRQAMNNPTFADIVRTRSAALRIESGQDPYSDWRMVPVVSHNRLLGSYEGTLGGKTGFTFKARRCFVGEVDRGGIRLIVAILNSPNSGALWNDARMLLDYGFARYGLASPPPVQPEPLPVLVRREPVESVDEEESQAMDQPTPVVRRVAMVRPAPPVEAEPPLLSPSGSPKPMIHPAPRVAAEPPTPDWQEEPEPMAVEAVTPAKPAVAARARLMARPVTVAKPVTLARPVVVVRSAPPVARPVTVTKPMVRPEAKPILVAKAGAMAKPMAGSVAKPTLTAKAGAIAKPVAKPTLTAKAGAIAKPVAMPVAKPTKPLVLAMATVKPTPTSVKIGKSGMASSGKAAPLKPASVAPVKLEKRETAKVAVRAEPVAKPQKAKR